MRALSVKHSPVALAALLALGALPVQAQVTSTTLPVVRPGGALVNASVGTPANNTLAITQTASAGNRGLIEWTSFSIGSAARVTITQPNAQSLLVNRVTGNGNGPTASEIHGSLTANGRVMLVNPAGVMFGSTAQVSTGSLVATTLDLTPGMAANNYEALMRGDDIALEGGAAAVSVAGANDPSRPQIQVGEGGSIVLLSQAQVEQNGVISAPRGEINMGTASAATLRSVGSSGFVQVLNATPAEPQSSSLSTGFGSQTLAAGGRIVIGGQPDERGTARGESVVIAGLVSTDSATGNGGSIHIDAGAQGSVNFNDASVTASSSSARGGSITVLGNNITIERGEGAGAEVLAEGATGGGTITFGDTRTRSIYLTEAALLSADATRNGNGGSVLLRALYHDPAATSPSPRVDFGVTESYGVLRARGGTEAGNGGNIETSGLAVTTTLDLGEGVRRGSIDAGARAAGGVGGTWTLDPYNITISDSAPVNVNGRFEPTAPGANIQASDIAAQLDAGTSVVISTDAGGAGTDAGNITVTPGTVIARANGTTPASLTLRANHSILFDNASVNASSGPLNLTLVADLDGNGTGSITLNRAVLQTGGGTLTLSGGTDPATGFARGDAQNAGVTIVGSQIDTRNASNGALAGDLIIRGQGGAAPGARAGVEIDNSFVTFGNLSVDGRASHGTAVLLNGNSQLRSDTGNADIRGVATRVDTATGNLIGIDAADVAIHMQLGNLSLAGRGDDANVAPGSAVGLRVGNLGVTSSPTTTGTVTLAGQSTGGSIAPGLQVDPTATNGLVIGAGGEGGLESINVVIGALADVRATSLELGTVGRQPDILTSGTVNIRPIGVDSNGQRVEQAAVPITVRANGSNAGAGTFTVASDMVNLVRAGGGVVIGSSAHTGAITIDNAAFPAAAQTSGAPLTFQNEGTGSGGISIGTGNVFPTLGLLSAGNITQAGGATGGFTAEDLVIRGGAASNVTLDNANNRINGVLAFDPPATLSVFTQGDLTVSAAAVAAYTPTTGFGNVAIAGSSAGNTALLQSGGNILIDRPITMTGTAGTTRLDIVSPGTVTFSSGATLSGGGGQWRVWAPDVVNPANAGGGTNLWGCVFGDTTTCRVSGIALPATGNQFLHAVQPTINVAANPSFGIIGLPLPTLTYTVTGLQGGDTPATALTGALSATQTGTTTYDIGLGTLASPTGYNLTFTPSTLTLRAPMGTRHMLMESFRAEILSDVYGKNLDSPFVCTAASVIRGGLADGTSGDALASEWGKVRNQPQLQGCLNVSDGGGCSAF
jgi:filamentous hemagglutinin family protein